MKSARTMQKEIYLDYAATTPMDQRVIDRVSQASKLYYGNPSSLHRLGMEAEQAIAAVRKNIAKTINCQESEVIFTSGGTEGNNMIIRGIVEKSRREKMRIITTAIEHPSVLDVFSFYQSHGIDVVFLEVDENGLIAMEDLQAALNEHTILVSIMGVNNELGTIQDLQAIGQLIKKSYPKCLFHSDFVQGYLKIPLDIKACRLDAITICAHKIFGPKGAGAVYLKKGLMTKPLLLGGGQEQGLRSGTQNVPGILGFDEAINLRKDIYLQDLELLQRMRDQLIEMLDKRLTDIKVNGQGSPYILNVSFNQVRGEVLLHSLEGAGIFVSTGSACSSHKKEKQYVLKAIGLPEDFKEGTIRISFSKDITDQDLEYTAEQIEKSVNSLRKLIRPKRK
ncbi:MAG: cysteine desulfurase [Eubacteriaceae bacterium]|nr:cysteine desulfurase [Eubacteriaceae bacterium]MDK2904145.1 cysteine desulfurase [Eubacteriaceae bacterium]MDK2936526.1 cysteine desulfurase [Eubacteriaceae bacterium]MDN5307164.1 cysteine desulfurase [Eubacteriaceae bacterium]